MEETGKPMVPALFGHSCNIYAERPDLRQQFECMWLMCNILGDYWYSEKIQNHRDFPNKCDPGHGKGSGSGRKDSLQGGCRHSRDGIYDFVALVGRWLNRRSRTFAEME